LIPEFEKNVTLPKPFWKLQSNVRTPALGFSAHSV
ncbi:unnamed protein product, partial [Allacma fusca]